MESMKNRIISYLIGFIPLLVTAGFYYRALQNNQSEEVSLSLLSIIFVLPIFLIIAALVKFKLKEKYPISFTIYGILTWSIITLALGSISFLMNAAV